MQILRASDYKRVPWKNGKGMTAEIAVSPPDASIDNFDCRISMAAVEEDGAFSLFENVDRTLIVLSGEGVTLSVGGSPPVDLRRGSAPHRFAADLPTTANLLGGAITDLNVMVRRGRAACDVRRQTAGPVEASKRGVTFVFAADRCTQSGVECLSPSDCALLEPGETLPLDDDERSSVIVIEFAASALGGEKILFGLAEKPR